MSYSVFNGSRALDFLKIAVDLLQADNVAVSPVLAGKLGTIDEVLNLLAGTVQVNEDFTRVNEVLLFWKNNGGNANICNGFCPECGTYSSISSGLFECDGKTLGFWDSLELDRTLGLCSIDTESPFALGTHGFQALKCLTSRETSFDSLSVSQLQNIQQAIRVIANFSSSQQLLDGSQSLIYEYMHISQAAHSQSALPTSIPAIPLLSPNFFLELKSVLAIVQAQIVNYGIISNMDTLFEELGTSNFSSTLLRQSNSIFNLFEDQTNNVLSAMSSQAPHYFSSNISELVSFDVTSLAKINLVDELQSVFQTSIPALTGFYSPLELQLDPFLQQLLLQVSGDYLNLVNNFLNPSSINQNQIIRSITQIESLTSDNGTFITATAFQFGLLIGEINSNLITLMNQLQQVMNSIHSFDAPGDYFVNLNEYLASAQHWSTVRTHISNVFDTETGVLCNGGPSLNSLSSSRRRNLGVSITQQLRERRESLESTYQNSRNLQTSLIGKETSPAFPNARSVCMDFKQSLFQITYFAESIHTSMIALIESLRIESIYSPEQKPNLETLVQTAEAIGSELNLSMEAQSNLSYYQALAPVTATAIKTLIFLKDSLIELCRAFKYLNPTKDPRDWFGSVINLVNFASNCEITTRSSPSLLNGLTYSAQALFDAFTQFNTENVFNMRESKRYNTSVSCWVDIPPSQNISTTIDFEVDVWSFAQSNSFEVCEKNVEITNAMLIYTDEFFNVINGQNPSVLTELESSGLFYKYENATTRFSYLSPPYVFSNRYMPGSCPAPQHSSSSFFSIEYKSQSVCFTYTKPTTRLNPTPYASWTSKLLDPSVAAQRPRRLIFVARISYENATEADGNSTCPQYFPPILIPDPTYSGSNAYCYPMFSSSFESDDIILQSNTAGVIAGGIFGSIFGLAAISLVAIRYKRKDKDQKLFTELNKATSKIRDLIEIIKSWI